MRATAEDKAEGWRASWVCRNCGRSNDVSWRWMMLTAIGRRLIVICRCGEPCALLKRPHSKKVMKRIVEVDDDEVPLSKVNV